MNYCAGGSLADFIANKISTEEQTSEGYVLSIFYQISAALLYCHEGSIVNSITSDSQSWDPVLHRDIKPGNSKFTIALRKENIFLTTLVLLSTKDETEQVIAKLADFGLSKVVDEGRAPSTYVGTRRYLAPVSLFILHCLTI